MLSLFLIKPVTNKELQARGNDVHNKFQ